MMELEKKARKWLRKNLPFPAVSLYQSYQDSLALPQSEVPYIFFLLAGELRLYTPSGILDYIPGQFSISAIDTPEKAYALSLSESGDLLAVTLEMTANDVLEVVLTLEDELVEQIVNDSLPEAVKTRQEQLVLDCLERLFDSFEESLSSQFLWEQIRKEMVFHLLCGSSGQSFLQSTTNMKQTSQIYEINAWIKRNYRQPFKIEELAEQWNMSVSNFHQKFKQAVGMGPLQCQKRLRLTESRRLMLDEGKSATEAAFEVGYESLSQFTREYRNMFGNSPTADIGFLKKAQQKQASFEEK